ncbi:MAG: MoaD/ThiS family protein [Gammaproteobacteria bacterium]
MAHIRIEYFAVLREHVGRAREELDTAAATVGELYAELDRRYAFPALGQVKAAVNDEFRDWSAPLKDGDLVVFIPPVAGG